jgi:regulatory protein
VQAVTNEHPSVPAAVIDTATIERWALAYLGRYASSAENLRRVLRRRARRYIGVRCRGADCETLAATDRLIAAVVARYRESGLLDDAAYAAARARRGMVRGQPLRRIAAGLAAKGVEASEAAAAIAALNAGAADPELEAACAFARRRRLGPFRARPAEPQRELAAFARAGFGRRVAERVLACADEAEVATLLSRHPP